MADTLQTLLAVLADGEFHSGEELGQLLGVSRTAVWKHLKKLADLELEIEKVKGRGYCIPGGFELLNVEKICGQLSVRGQAALTAVEVFHTIDSTNCVARKRVEAGDATGVVIVAERQTAGRGRRGREWVSPFARNLYLSTSWEFEGGAAALEGLSLAVGVAVKRALENSGLNQIQLKWPNDILHEGNKLGGILLEMIGDPAGLCQVIVGIGINVSMPDLHGEGITQGWTDVCRVAGQAVSRNQVVAELLNELLPMLESYHQDGFSSYREEWEQSDAFRGEVVRLITPGNEIQGVAEGVSDSGAICINIDGKRCFFNGGEISLRRAK